MPDTIRTKHDILDLFPINTAGEIGAQDIRDAVVSIYSGREVNAVYERNVLEFGADPSGVADSTNAFRSAIQNVYGNVYNRSGTVLIPQGIYKVSLITMYPGVSLVGLAPGSATLVPYNATGTGLIEFHVAPITRTNIRNLTIDGTAEGVTGALPQWGIYAEAKTGTSSLTGGWWESDVTDVDILGLDNGIWIRAGATGANLPCQYINFTRVYIERNSGVDGINLKLSGQANQIQIDDCVLTASSAANRQGTALWIGSDGTPTGFRYPQGIESTLLAINSCQKACTIQGGQGINFSNPCISGTHYGFDISGVLSSGATEVVVISAPRFAADVGSSAEVGDGFLIKAGINSKVHATDLSFLAGSCALPFVNASSRGLYIEAATNVAQAIGFNGKTSGMTRSIAVTGTGTAGVLDLAGHKTVRITGSGNSVSKINSQLLPGETATGIVATNNLLLNTTNSGKNIVLSRGLTSCTVPVDRVITVTRLDGLSGADYAVDFAPMASTVASLAPSSTLADLGSKINELILALQNAKLMN